MALPKLGARAFSSYPTERVLRLSIEAQLPFFSSSAPCGSAGTVEASDATQTLSSPNYPAAPGTNLRCRWLVDGNGTAVQLRFQHLSIGSADPAQQCSNDRLEIQDVITV